jgi:hypothetical protein
MWATPSSSSEEEKRRCVLCEHRQHCFCPFLEKVLQAGGNAVKYHLQLIMIKWV